MTRHDPFPNRINNSSSRKNSKIVLALDHSTIDNLKYVLNQEIILLEQYICAIKFNLHIMLPLSFNDMVEINSIIHHYGLQSIADIKLNDIESTNHVVVSHLTKMGFDAVIVNPFVGTEELESIVNCAHKSSLGVISLVYMSHVSAKDGYGINIISNFDTHHNISQMYLQLLRYSHRCNVDGIIVGATRIEILNQISRRTKIPIYSPGLGIQGGDLKAAAKNGTDYFIIGRLITQSQNPVMTAKRLRNEINKMKRTKV
jgi:orotidine-5'-phosphate decarboxylase